MLGITFAFPLQRSFATFWHTKVIADQQEFFHHVRGWASCGLSAWRH